MCDIHDVCVVVDVCVSVCTCLCVCLWLFEIASCGCCCDVFVCVHGVLACIVCLELWLLGVFVFCVLFCVMLFCLCNWWSL